MLLVRELRAPFFTASIIPILLGSAIAWSRGAPFSPGLFLLTLVGGVLLHAGTNVANDYFDHKSGTDDINVEYVNPFTGGSRMIQEGLLSPRQVLTFSLALFAVASVIGVRLAAVRGPFILLLGAVGIFSGFFYTAPPFRFAHRGLGELFVGLNFGVLMTLGAYFVIAGKFDREPVLASIPVALLIIAVLYINQFQDYTADRAVGKNNIVVMLGKKKARIGYIAILLFVYAWILITALSRSTSPFTLLALLTFPIAFGAMKRLLTNYERTRELAPANAATILLHASVGALLSVAYLLDRII